MKKIIHSAFYVWAKSANGTRQSRQISSARQQQSRWNNDTKVNTEYTNKPAKTGDSWRIRWHNGCDEMWSFVVHMHFYSRICSFRSFVPCGCEIFCPLSDLRCWNRFEVNEISNRLDRNKHIFSIAFDSSAFWSRFKKYLSFQHLRKQQNFLNEKKIRRSKKHEANKIFKAEMNFWFDVMLEKFQRSW